MIYLPWAAFVVAVVWMIRQGFSAKKEYERRARERQQLSESVAREAPRERALLAGRGQGQAPELAETLGQKRGSPNAIGFGASR
ncbi:MAG TPA: hypothetical protein VGR93_10645 [Candidatus Acidoferrales bacterium]|nr:hypothetical protein [Candidatus Acidoferrales bacterium]